MKQHLKQPFPPLAGLKTFLIVWSTQNLSTLGSAMTSFALVVWSYQQQDARCGVGFPEAGLDGETHCAAGHGGTSGAVHGNALLLDQARNERLLGGSGHEGGFQMAILNAHGIDGVFREDDRDRNGNAGIMAVGRCGVGTGGETWVIWRGTEGLSLGPRRRVENGLGGNCSPTHRIHFEAAAGIEGFLKPRNGSAAALGCLKGAVDGYIGDEARSGIYGQTNRYFPVEPHDGG